MQDYLIVGVYFVVMFILSLLSLEAIDQEFANQDALIEQHKASLQESTYISPSDLQQVSL